jgi:uncharacterized circularly permuted ATP-grasp superfamily protein/uncharacterized alpha-E superfamily protein
MQKILLANYPAAPGNYDEMLDSSNQPRAHWRTVLDHLAAEAPDLMRQRVESVQRQVRENGVTYNVYDDSKGAQRPWDLNVLPIVLPHDEWVDIEAAVVQRATLLNQIVRDAYGPQQLLAAGLLPAALIHGHSGFLRPCHNIKHPGDIALHFYAVDLARAPDGGWWVVNDRTQAPSGAGYALENRLVISRVFPDLFRDMRIQRLAGFFSTMRDSLAHWGRQCAANNADAPGSVPLRDSEQPLIVLLTPGPYNETYHEQAFLARYLGFPLVEGSDLTVRNGIVWLKTLSGLQRVHVIMRRVDDDYCDPLELRADSALGVPGLIEAVRRGNVLVTNSLGSNLPESGALLGFLPAICERLLGEPLKMPSVGTWWCGEPAALEEVIERLDEFIIKPTFPQLRQFPVFGQDMQGAEREALVGRMRAHPQQYVAQELVHLSQAPVWRSEPPMGLSASAIGLRVFACATPNGYVVMPGGLTRVATGQDARVITMQRGGSSKDTWVQAAGKVEAVTLLRRSIGNSDLIREDTHLSSRVAENLYWFGRHIERCNNICRLMRATLDYMFTNPRDYRSSEWPAIQWLCARFDLIPDDLAIQINAQNQDQGQLPGLEHSAIISDEHIESTLLHAIVSLDVPGLASRQQHLYQVASQLRERLSLDNWRTLNQMAQRLGSHKEAPSPADALAILDDVTTSLMGMAGFAMDGMTRDKGWRFFSSGRRLERLQFLCTVLERALRMEVDSNLEWLLELSDSIVTYRSRYMSQPEWLRVLDLLLLDDSNPRSVVFQLKGLLKYLKKLANSYGSFGEQILAPLFAELQALSPATDLHCGNERLIDLIGRINLTSYTLSEQIAVRFFSYTGTDSYGARKA